MRETNAMLIQETLRQQKYVTIPWLQREYALSYDEARQFLRQLAERGWVDPQVNGIQYAVRPQFLCLRKIRRNEVDALYENLTKDCILVLSRMDEMEGQGATEAELERAVRGMDDTTAAIRILLKQKLIYQANDLYFLTISSKSVSVLWRVDMEKRKASILRKNEGDGQMSERIRMLFEELFED